MNLSITSLLAFGLVTITSCAISHNVSTSSSELFMSRMEGFFSTLANTTDIINLLIDNYSKSNQEEAETDLSIMNKQEGPGNTVTLENDLYPALLQGLSVLFRYGKDTAAVLILWTIILGPVVAILSTVPMTAVVFAAMYLTPLLDLSRIREWVFPEYALPTPPIRLF